jgi:hypothetical protein
MPSIYYVGGIDSILNEVDNFLSTSKLKITMDINTVWVYDQYDNKNLFAYVYPTSTIGNRPAMGLSNNRSCHVLCVELAIEAYDKVYTYDECMQFIYEHMVTNNIKTYIHEQILNLPKGEYLSYLSLNRLLKLKDLTT